VGAAGQGQGIKGRLQLWRNRQLHWLAVLSRSDQNLAILHGRARPQALAGASADEIAGANDLRHFIGLIWLPLGRVQVFRHRNFLGPVAGDPFVIDAHPDEVPEYFGFLHPGSRAECTDCSEWDQPVKIDLIDRDEPFRMQYSPNA
jgi:hypothetical protein